ncbi:(2Fe-2S)-binding protein [Candidatus Poriferisocius sp.]|uniref:(2Fe-2S)-binding protein n=1 Tax=Candidatus Poriferisocius sp. TaxID=3101276 RepID=UPI003B018C6B
MADPIPLSMTVNGRTRRGLGEPRLTLADFLREQAQCTGVHLGCEHGVCGSCTVLMDGDAVRSCLLFAVQADGADITTVEGLAPDDETLHPVQEAFRDCHGLQCGFCTPGFVVSVVAFLEANPDPSDEEIRHGISGNLCRCTGYQGIVAATRQAAAVMKGGQS